MTRTADTSVTNGADLNGDGQVSVDDDLQARVDAANAAGADLLISVHNNGGPASLHGTSVYYCIDSTHGQESRAFAALAQQALGISLQQAGYQTTDLGFHDDAGLGKPYGHLFLTGAKTPRVARPSEMPAIVGESLFVSNPTEAKLLGRADVVYAIARAMPPCSSPISGGPPPPRPPAERDLTGAALSGSRPAHAPVDGDRFNAVLAVAHWWRPLSQHPASESAVRKARDRIREIA